MLQKCNILVLCWRSLGFVPLKFLQYTVFPNALRHRLKRYRTFFHGLCSSTPWRSYLRILSLVKYIPTFFWRLQLSFQSSRSGDAWRYSVKGVISREPLFQYLTPVKICVTVVYIKQPVKDILLDYHNTV
jgi:hypothetical protein